MAAMKAGPTVPTWLAAGLIGVVIGGAGGFYGSTWNAKAASAPPGAAGGPGGGPGGGMMGGPGGPGGGGGGAQDHPNAAALIRTVSSLAMLEKTRGRELTADQRAKVAAAAAALKSDAALTEAQCEEKLTALKASLSSEQQELLEELTPRRGRGGGGGGRPGGMAGGPGGPAGGAPGGNGPGAGNGPGGRLVPTMMGTSPGGPPGGMGGGAQIDFERPFKEGRGRERLEELLTLLGK